ncbi:GNAT family N-acetyltransferase [Nocardioides sp.]|uniref:GNAT family N-acetyltransferase n=1 Tax=Nocardioides sp. TaxID=35761 RepID=UPI0035114089
MSSAAPDGPVPVRAVTAEDHAAITALLRTAFADEGPAVADLVDDVRARELVGVELVALAPAGEIPSGGRGASSTVVGHVALSHAWLDTRSERLDVLLLSPLAVAPGQQRRGIGAGLLAAALAEADRSGAPFVVLEGAPGYYSRHGFVPASAYGIDAPSPRIPGPAFQVAALSAHEPWMTGRVVYREVWWEHDAVGLRDPALARFEMALPDGG